MQIAKVSMERWKDFPIGACVSMRGYLEQREQQLSFYYAYAVACRQQIQWYRISMYDVVDCIRISYSFYRNGIRDFQNFTQLQRAFWTR